MDKKEDCVIEYFDNGMGIKQAVLYDEHVNVSSNPKKFDARIDGTDHAAFYCDKCQSETRIVKLELFKHSKDSKDMHPLKITHDLHFELYCETCGGTETKKMYLNNPIGEVDWQ